MGGLCFASLTWLRLRPADFAHYFPDRSSNPAFKVGATTLTAVRAMSFLEPKTTDSVSHRPPWLTFGIRELLWLNFTSERAGGLRMKCSHLPSSTLQISFRL
ncbi:hypothetical protein B0H14DRAFT_2779798 [Mycena olivaceomarginata]|nr:hypothetical protein B0H14DRAFT_2779798 [Mycena olivaceomarginata]